MSRYMDDILSVGSFRHDINKRKSNEGKIEKYRPISTIYWTQYRLQMQHMKQNVEFYNFG